MNLSPLKTTVSKKVISLLWYFGREFYTHKEKQRQAAWTPNVVCCGCVALSKPSNCSFPLTSMSFGSLALSCTLLLQQLQWLQQDRWFRLYTRVSSAVVWKQTVLQVAGGKGRDVFSIPFPLKKTVWRPYSNFCAGFRIEFALLLLALYKRFEANRV